MFNGVNPGEMKKASQEKALKEGWVKPGYHEAAQKASNDTASARNQLREPAVALAAADSHRQALALAVDPRFQQPHKDRIAEHTRRAQENTPAGEWDESKHPRDADGKFDGKQKPRQDGDIDEEEEADREKAERRARDTAEVRQINKQEGENHLAKASALTRNINNMRASTRANARKEIVEHRTKAAEHAAAAGEDWDESKHPRDADGKFV
jgi:hypothetical protein